MKYFLSLSAVLFLAYSFSDFTAVQKGYTPQELRDLYGSGNQSLWPKPHLFDEAKEGFQDIGVLSKPEFPVDNPYSEAKEELGKKLFFDPRLSKSGQISCANCHDPELAWADGRRVAYGHDRQLGTRNAPTVLNIVYAKKYFWDGRAATLEDQAKAPIENPVEMNFHSRLAVKTIAKIKGYKEHFQKAFGSDKVTEENIVKAIATFERTIVSPKSKFDKFVSGEKDALTDSEINGLHLFRTKANCINCHNTPYFSDQKFHNVGLTYFGREYEDLGLYNISKKNEDVGKFKTATLREISQTAPYMHNGLFPNIRGVLNMYNAGMPTEKRNRESQLAPQKSKMLEKLNLTDEELTDLENFLNTLHSYKYKMRAPELPK
ncbi:cytochrome-c peroxidase [Chryseobacterium taiwanense]|uniref:Methylamine utilization protein MauG n=1 Tax=Chryseobacterium taiwanense TaxID=363331 RepID=A0A0B4CYT1_9FLAO|nr:cytochrome c peroxidase [Chryseobacterium taiwanense]KIC61527.1 cytochrome C peroxidase [Chryseobacterium taiwanense]